MSGLVSRYKVTIWYRQKWYSWASTLYLSKLIYIRCARSYRCTYTYIQRGGNVRKRRKRACSGRIERKGRFGRFEESAVIVGRSHRHIEGRNKNCRRGRRRKVRRVLCFRKKGKMRNLLSRCLVRWYTRKFENINFLRRFPREKWNIFIFLRDISVLWR